MTVLQALDRYYGRMAARGDAESPGYSREKIGFAIVLDAGGAPVDVLDLHVAEGKRTRPRLLEVPAAAKRTAGILPNRLWDKTAYVLGRTGGGGKRTAEENAAFQAEHRDMLADATDPELVALRRFLKRIAEEHAAFQAMHRDMLADATDPGLVALRRFLTDWTPDRFDSPPFGTAMLDANIVFRLDGDMGFLHEREAARAAIARKRAASDEPTAFCLVTGTRAPVRRLHPTIKGVEGAQSSGAALVSFNLDAFQSYGKEQGDNAPTSEIAAFRYGASLNRMLDRGSRNRLARPVGGTTVAYWADASGHGEAAAAAAEDWFAAMFDPPNEERDAGPTARLGDALRTLADGRPLKDADPRLEDGVRFHVLGLAPNAARLSVRFWLDDRFEVFARRLADHYADMEIEPRPWRAQPPSVGWLLVKTTALLEKFENIPPMLAGETMRAVLGGGLYPRALLAAAIMRVRAGDDPGTGWHATAIRAVLARDHRLHHRQEGVSVSLDRENPNPAYRLGRLFSALETAQKMALGRVNATIRDRYFGAASATPASVFPILLRGTQSHLGKLRKAGKGGWLEREIEDICEHLPDALPTSLRMEAQGRFVIGYYHQRKARFAGKPVEDIEREEDIHDDE